MTDTRIDYPQLDPKNDYVFKRAFTACPDALVHLINDLRPDLPEITEVEILNPAITPEEMTGKHIVLDILAKDQQGNLYNIEMQVRRYNDWGKRSAFYMARLLGDQLIAGDDYAELKAVIGIHLLDFDLFMADAVQQQQALWRFELRDAMQPQVSIGDEIQLNIIEMKKADRLGLGDQHLKDWITYFEHWKEDNKMATVTHEPVKRIRGYVRQLSADEEARRIAFVRERALRDEAYQLKQARMEGEARGRIEGQVVTLLKLIQLKFGECPNWADQQIHQATDLQLQSWIEKILAADSIEDLLAD